MLPAPDVAAVRVQLTGREINFSCHRAAREIAIFQPGGRAAANPSGNLWHTRSHVPKSLGGARFRLSESRERIWKRANDARLQPQRGLLAKASNRILTA